MTPTYGLADFSAVALRFYMHLGVFNQPVVFNTLENHWSTFSKLDNRYLN